MREPAVRRHLDDVVAAFVADRPARNLSPRRGAAGDARDGDGPGRRVNVAVDRPQTPETSYTILEQ